MSLVVFSTIAFATVITSFISGILGMAGGMILMGVLIALLPVSAAMMLHGITQFAANGWRAWMLRGAIDWRIIRGYAAGSLAALAIFAIAQWVVSKPVSLLMLGAMPFLTLALPENLKLDVERRGHPTACGFICAGLALVAGVAGPVLDVFFVRSRMGRHAVVATKASSQTLTHLLKIIYFGGVLASGTSGEIGPLIAGTMIALAFVGTTLSKQVLERIDDASFRAWTRWTVMSVGVVYLASGITMLLK